MEFTKLYDEYHKQGDALMLPAIDYPSQDHERFQAGHHYDHMKDVCRRWDTVDFLDVNVQRFHQNWNTLKNFDFKDLNHEIYLNQTVKFWPNTEFRATQGIPTKKLILCIGESWCYGGQIRDMNCEVYSESFNSVFDALFNTMGSWLSYYTQADLHQFAIPGNNNTQMVQYLNDRLTDIASESYTDILITLQMTDHCREFGVNCLDEILPTDSPMKGMFPENRTNCELYADHKDYNSKYWNNLWNWVDQILCKARADTGKNIECMMWSNFFNTKLLPGDRSFMLNPQSWNHFGHSLEGGVISDPDFYNTQFIPYPEGMIPMYNPDWEYVEDQITQMEIMQQWWIDSANRMYMHHQYPSKLAHQLWALQLVNKAGWLTYPD